MFKLHLYCSFGNWPCAALVLDPAGEAWSWTQEAWRRGEETEGGKAPAAGGTEEERGGGALQTKTGERMDTLGYDCCTLKCLWCVTCLCFTAVPSAAGTDHEVSAAEPAAAERARGHRMEWKPGRSSVSGQSCRKEHGTPGAGGRETSQTAAAESSAAAKGKNTLGSELFNMHLNGW